jgi:hypothetical protein
METQDKIEGTVSEVLGKETAVAEYKPFYAQLTELETENAKLVFNYETPAGNKDARSHVYKLRQTKGALERTRKSAKEESLRIGRAIDAEAKDIEKRLESMIGVHQIALDAIEQREKDRVARLEERLAEISAIGSLAGTSVEFAAAIEVLEPMLLGDDWHEFRERALDAKDKTLRSLRQRHAERVEHEAREAELARLRAEAQERERKERDERIAHEAAERARAEAEAKAQAEREAAARREAEAEARAKAEREAADRRELELKLQAEAAERRRIEAEQRVEQERVEAAAQAERQYKEATARAAREAEEAVKREQDRVAAAKAAEEAEQAKREANKAHKTRVNRAALAALVEGGLTEEQAKLCVTLIASGKVPAVAIAY